MKVGTRPECSSTDTLADLHKIGSAYQAPTTTEEKPVDPEPDSVTEIDPHLSPVWGKVLLRWRWAFGLMWTYAFLNMAHEWTWDSFILAYLTNLSFLWVTLYWIISAVLMDVPACRTYVREHTWLRRILNIVFQVCCTNAVSLDILYWALVYTPGQTVQTYTIVAHLLQLIPLGLDFFVNSVRYSFLDGLAVIALDICYLVTAAFIHLQQDRWVYTFMSKLTGAKVAVYVGIIIGVYIIHCLILLANFVTRRVRARRPIAVSGPAAV